MSEPTFPLSGDAREDITKTKAGYVEYAAFAGAGAGYFCGTCAAFQPETEGQDGYCRGLKVPVVTYGCCNNWRIAPRRAWIGADGESL